MKIITDIISEIAAREGVDPLEIEPPLYDAIGENLLEFLTTDTESWEESRSTSIEFQCYGYAVKIDEAGNVCVSDPASRSNECSELNTGKSPQTVSAGIGHPERAVKHVADVIAARNRPFTERLKGILEAVRRDLGMESATLSYVNADSYVFETVAVADHVEIHAGEVVSLEDTACRRVVETEQALVLRDIETDAPELANSAFEVSSYIGVPVFVDGDVYGTFCFYDKDPRSEAFSEWDLAYIELLSTWVSSELEKRKRERALHAAETVRPRTTN